jgi:hypothetical protein
MRAGTVGYEYQMSGVKLNTTDEERDVTTNLKLSTRGLKAAVKGRATLNYLAWN